MYNYIFRALKIMVKSNTNNIRGVCGDKHHILLPSMSSFKSFFMLIKIKHTLFTVRQEKEVEWLSNF